MAEDTIIDAEVEEPKSCDDVPRGTNKGGRPKGKKDSPNTARQNPKKELKVLELAAKNLTQAEIAKAVELSPQRVKTILESFKPVFQELENVDGYREVKGDILGAGQLAALKSAFSGTKLKKAGFLSTLQGFDLLNKAERLHNGQSTENNSVSIFGKLQVDAVVRHTKDEPST